MKQRDFWIPHSAFDLDQDAQTCSRSDNSIADKQAESETLKVLSISSELAKKVDYLIKFSRYLFVLGYYFDKVLRCC